MGPSQLRLLASRKFLSIFVTQFLGALNDNLLKNALVIRVAYRNVGSSSDVEIIVTVATALFILPYFLFSATAGEVADKVEKAKLIRIVKLWEIGVMCLATFSFALSDGLDVGLAVLFLLGIQATFFGPVKYGILPELLAPEDLLSGNAVIEAGTFLAILIGTIAGGLLILTDHGPALVSVALLLFAVGGWIASLFIPHLGARAPRLRVNPNIIAETISVLRYANAGKLERWTILGNSWFWFVGVAVVSQFPNYAKDVLGADNQVVTLFLTINSLGVGLGALFAGKLLHGALSARLVPWSALFMAIAAFDLWLAGGTPHGAGLIDAMQFITTPDHWRIALDLFVVAFGAGMFVVPLYTIMQAKAVPSHRARVVAANNVWNALFMVGAALGSVVMLKLGAGVTGIFLTLAVSNGVVAAATWKLRKQQI